MKYPVAERFKAPQGEGLYAGTPFAFVRLVGCSVGKGTCTHCDTEFDKVREALGGGLYDPEEIVAWAAPYRHVCFTGGEPLDRDLRPLLQAVPIGTMVHVETSGTKRPDWIEALDEAWLCVSPKPGYLAEMVADADEIKVILGGLGDGPGWPKLDDAVRWADEGRLVYLQPRNDYALVNRPAMDEVLVAVDRYPQLRLSAQLHKYLRTR